ncbi:MAG: 16S rRNA processing protein RimM [Gemmatimonadetes bacterium]|nr:16S rRNA processing protein RimM [Gemmatimonadota bacterium]
MARPNPPFLAVGYVEKPHGTKGELRVRLLSDRVHVYFAEGARVRIAGPGGELPDGDYPPTEVERARPFQRGLLVKLDVLHDRSAAEAVRQRYLLVPFEEVEPLEEGELFYHQLLGLTAVTPTGEALGVVSEIYELASSHLLEVRGSERTHLIPLVGAIVKAVDLDADRIVLDPPPGLLEL